MKYRTKILLGRRNAFFFQVCLLFFYIATYAFGLIQEAPPQPNVAYAILLTQSLWALISWLIIYGSLFNLYGLFLIIFFITHCSLAILYLMGLTPIFFSVYLEQLNSSFTIFDIWNGYFLATIFLSCIHLGGIKAPKNNKFLKRYEQPHQAAIHLTSLFLVSVGSVSLLIFATEIFSNIGSLGYLSYTVALKEANTFVLNLSYMIVAGSLLAISTTRSSRIWPYALATFLYIAIFTIVGSRHKSIFVLLALLYAFIKRGVRIPTSFIYGVGVAVVLGASAWSSIRLGGSVSLNEISKLPLSLAEASLSELGVYIIWVITTVRDFPDPSMANFGVSYVNSLFVSIPFGQRLFYSRDAAGWWIAEKYFSEIVDEGFGFGTGFSPIAEAFSSFWWLGFVPMFLFGYLIAFLSNSEKNSPVARAFIASIIPYVLFFPRDSSSLLFRGILWYGLVPIFIYLVVRRLISPPKNIMTSFPKLKA